MKKMKQVKEFTIDRSKWHTGSPARDAKKKHGADSALYVPENKRMCCLGFFGKACGLTQKDISGRALLSSVNGYDVWEEILPHVDQEQLSGINDGTSILSTKEKKIKAIFAKNGIKVKFVGKLLT